MSQIIAGTYEVQTKIGAGGGGIIYLGRHLRLGKWVVLKADKRMLSAKPETLRREVDALKNLSHTYIPQVYDYIVQDGVIYTVMDYIEGESLDKPLKRGERFAQAQVVEWACQLLEALCYLHSRPPHGILHADIKPANIMLTPEGDIRLIDFNIALALGEEGAVRVGYSQGYASPEHYGSDVPEEPLAATKPLSANSGLYQWKTVVMADEPAAASEKSSEKFSGSSGSRHNVWLDVRSDIYSLGATLYHLLTGVRPAKRVEDVVPASAYAEISPAVAAIIEKAMAADPEERYQSAAEMLFAFEHLHENDPRSRRLRRLTKCAAAVTLSVLVLGSALTFTGLTQLGREQNAYALSEYSANALQQGDVNQAVALALQALPEQRSFLDPPYTAAAQAALAAALGVYDLSDGYKAQRAITLASEPLKLTVSPSGTYTATLTQGKVIVYATADGELQAELSAADSALADIIFAAEDKLIYAGDGAVAAYDLSSGSEIWRGKPATALALSADGQTLAAIYKDETQATVYNAQTGAVIKTVDFGTRRQNVLPNDVFADPEDNLLAISGSGRWLAVSFNDGALMLYDLQNSANDLIVYEKSDYTHFEGGFCGEQLAYAAAGGGETYFAVVDAAGARQLGSFSGTWPYHTRADASGIYVTNQNLLIKLDALSGTQTELAYTEADIEDFAIGESYNMVKTADGAYAFYDQVGKLLERHESADSCDFLALGGAYAVTASLNSPQIKVLALENHVDKQLASYPIAYSHDEARISADRQTAMLFSYSGFRIYDMNGGLVAEAAIPDADEVYDQQYRRDETVSYLEVIYNDGLRRYYSAADGKLLREEQGEKPDGTLTEEFLTDKWRIVSPLHGTPQVYDRESGELLRELEPDSYLTYVTQVGEAVVTEYITAQGERFGLLLDWRGETLARLPGLCDVWPDGTLVFDDMRGNLRQTRIYSIDELIALAQNY